MKKLLFLLFLTSISSFAQQIQGRVLDENNQPLPGANIYFDGTTIAAIADSQENFSLEYSKKLNSILAISFIGYQTHFIKDVDNSTELVVVLKVAFDSLSVVVIKKDPFSRKQKMQLFRDYFLGKTKIAKNAKIENEDDIYFDYDEKSLVLSAFSNRSLIINNDELGYKITYELVSFEAQLYRHGHFEVAIQNVSRSFYAGLTRFEEIASDEKISKLRERCYKGSMLHFFRNLANNSLVENDFTLYKETLAVKPNEHFTISDIDDSKRVQVKNQSKDLNKFSAVFNVFYTKKLQSKIIFQTDTLTIDKNGINTNLRDIMFLGYMAEQKVGEMLPINYGIQ